MLESLTAIAIVQARMADPLARETLAALLEKLRDVDIPEFHIEGVAATAAVLWAAGHVKIAADLVVFVDATDQNSADARHSIDWLRPLLADTIAAADAVADECQIARDALDTLEYARRWLAGPPEQLPG